MNDADRAAYRKARDARLPSSRYLDEDTIERNRRNIQRIRALIAHNKKDNTP